MHKADRAVQVALDSRWFRLVVRGDPAIVVGVPHSTGLPVVVIGAGLTGLSAALHLRSGGYEGPLHVVERDVRIGGKAQSERIDGHTFDVTGHWLHLRDPTVEALVAQIFAPGDLVSIERRTGVFTHGVMLPYPFQANLYGLPKRVVATCLTDFVMAQRDAVLQSTPPTTFRAFAEARFGRGIAEAFFVPYNRKLWGEHFEALTIDQIRRFVPEPDIPQVVAGAVGLPQEGLGYNARLLYPRTGGIDALPSALLRAATLAGDLELCLGVALTRVDLEARRVSLSDGRSLPFSRLISTVPLPDLVDLCSDAPDAVASARRTLRWVKWRYLNIGVAARPPISEHWVYVPEPEFPFFRVGIFSNVLPAMAPEGHSSLYVELTDREGPLDGAAVLSGLVRIGALCDPSAVKFMVQREIDCAYVVFDEDHGRATRAIRTDLALRSVWSTGRYGAWTYNSMEDAILQGREAARWVLE